MFGATNLVKSRDKEDWVYMAYGIAFVRAGSWNFDNELARINVIFGVDIISSSSHTGNHKNNFFVLAEGPTYGINGSFDSPEKNLLFTLLR